ncbi:hypothetical protein [Sphingomonas hankookensis]|uniref:Uncharacterized protein n=1 Tax=Sphingomonas hankookensis TaxID=563996 RepID=A0ABR5YDH4_9SPHN|nr:hypothetical protein [Sphingomonas hankookensis]KZE16238.1 hypothetical protein AVT10_12110 [Sphingomonas hankookensis]
MTALRPYLAIVGAVVAVALLAAAYIAGRRDGRAIADGKQAAVEKAVKAERDKREALVAASEAAGAAKETDRQEKVREIYRETNTITERPVYRNLCVDADGVRLVERATAIANGNDPGASPVTPGDPAPAAPQR